MSEQDRMIASLARKLRNAQTEVRARGNIVKCAATYLRDIGHEVQANIFEKALAKPRKSKP